MTHPESSRAFGELLEAARCGEPGAWDRVFARLADTSAEGAQLLAVARRLLPRGDRLRNFAESGDFVQSALREGWADLDKFRGETPAELIGWLRTILRHKVSHRARRKETEREARNASSGIKAQPDEQASPLSELAQQDEKLQLQDKVRQLPENQQEVLRLRLEGLSTGEIAALLGTNEAAVRKRESRAAQRLRELLGE